LWLANHQSYFLVSPLLKSNVSCAYNTRECITLHTIELSVKSPCLCPPFHPLSLFQWYPQSNETLLNLSISCTRFESNSNSCTGRSNDKEIQGFKSYVCQQQIGGIRQFGTILFYIAYQTTNESFQCWLHEWWELGGMQFKEEMYKNLTAHKKDEDRYKRHLFVFKAFPNLMYRNPDSSKPTSPTDEANKDKYSGVTCQQ